MMFEARKVVNWVKRNEYVLLHTGFDSAQDEDEKRCNTMNSDTERLIDSSDESKTRVAKQIKKTIGRT